MTPRVASLLSWFQPSRTRGHGGDVELVKIEEQTVFVRLQGACAGCPMSQMTLANFVEKELKGAIPEVKRVEPVL